MKQRRALTRVAVSATAALAVVCASAPAAQADEVDLAPEGLDSSPSSIEEPAAPTQEPPAPAPPAPAPPVEQAPAPVEQEEAPVPPSSEAAPENSTPPSQDPDAAPSDEQDEPRSADSEVTQAPETAAEESTEPAATSSAEQVAVGQALAANFGEQKFRVGVAPVTPGAAAIGTAGSIIEVMFRDAAGETMEGGFRCTTGASSTEDINGVPKGSSFCPGSDLLIPVALARPAFDPVVQEPSFLGGYYVAPAGAFVYFQIISLPGGLFGTSDPTPVLEPCMAAEGAFYCPSEPAFIDGGIVGQIPNQQRVLLGVTDVEPVEPVDPQDPDGPVVVVPGSGGGDLPVLAPVARTGDAVQAASTHRLPVTDAGRSNAVLPNAVLPNAGGPQQGILALGAALLVGGAWVTRRSSRRETVDA